MWDRYTLHGTIWLLIFRFTHRNGPTSKLKNEYQVGLTPHFFSRTGCLNSLLVRTRRISPFNDNLIMSSQLNFFRLFPDFKYIKCYQCASKEDCESAKPKICPNGSDRCYMVSTDVTHEDSDIKLTTYSKGCATKSQCDNKNAHVFHQTCTDDSTCDMTCCESDMCNAGYNVVVSAFTLLACALFAVVCL